MEKQYRITLDVQEKAWDSAYPIAREAFDKAKDFTIIPGDGGERVGVAFMLTFDGEHLEAYNFVVESILEGYEARCIADKDIFVSVADVDTGAINLKHLV